MDQGALAGLIGSAVEIMTPLLLVSSIELLVQRSGVINLAVEGTMLMGAFTAYMVTLYSNDPLLGLLLAMLIGAAFSGVYASLVIKIGLDQMVSGIAMSILALGITAYIYRLLIGPGKPLQVVPTLGRIEIPYAESLPIFGELLSQIPVSYVAIFMPIIVWGVLHRSRVGVLIRASGEDPERACRLGARVSRIRAYLLILEGVVAGLSGALLSIGYSGVYVDNMTAGRGYVAVALVILSSWSPIKLLPAVAIFSFIEATQLRLQASGAIPIPYQLALAMPYIATIAALAISGRSSRSPRSLASNENPC